MYFMEVGDGTHSDDPAVKGLDLFDELIDEFTVLGRTDVLKKLEAVAREEIEHQNWDLRILRASSEADAFYAMKSRSDE